jgi:transcriptional regulator with XRE-family HTH domain
MFQNLGQQIKILRGKKSQDELAKKLGVSKGYISELENGITTNVKLSFLQKVQEELNVFPTIPHEGLQDPISIRMLRANEQLANLHKEDSQAVEYLLDNLEQSIKWFSERMIKGDPKQSSS